MWDTFLIDKDDGVAIMGAWWLGKAVLRRRVRLGLTQRRLEDLTGVDQTTISRLETGRLKGIKHVRLLKIIGTLNGLDEYGPPPWYADPRRPPPPVVTLDDSGGILYEELGGGPADDDADDGHATDSHATDSHATDSLQAAGGPG